MSTIDVVRGATRPRGSAVLLESWQADAPTARAWMADAHGDRPGEGSDGAPGSAFWLRSLRELGGVPQRPLVARSPLVGAFDA